MIMENSLILTKNTYLFKCEIEITYIKMYIKHFKILNGLKMKCQHL